MADVNDEAQPGAKNLIRGYEKGEAFKPGEVVKSSETAAVGDIGERALAKNLISSFEQGRVQRASVEIASEKPEVNEAFARNLISSFEHGKIHRSDSGDSATGTAAASEKPVTRPGVTEKLKKVYESFDKSEANNEAAPLSPTASAQTKTAAKPTTESENMEKKTALKDATAEKKKTVLVVFAHWKRQTSFNGAMFDAALTALKEAGYEVMTSDLYQLNWNPVVSKDDIGGMWDVDSTYFVLFCDEWCILYLYL